MYEYDTVVGSVIKYDKIRVVHYSSLALGLVLEREENGCDVNEVVSYNPGNCAGNMSVIRKYCAVLNTEGCPSIEKFIKKYKLGKPYKRFGSPVFLFDRPLYELNEKKLKELDPEGCEEYEKHYDEIFDAARKDVIENGYF